MKDSNWMPPVIVVLVLVVIALVAYILINSPVQSSRLRSSSHVGPVNRRSFHTPEGLCDLDWTYYGEGSKCLKILERRLLYGNAEKECEKLGGSLVVIRSWTDEQFIRESLPANWSNVSALWLGLRRAFKFEPFEWTDGTPLGYTNWFKGDPFMSPPGTTYVENCAKLEFQSGDRDRLVTGWRSAPCAGETNSVICEKYGCTPHDEYRPIKTCSNDGEEGNLRCSQTFTRGIETTNSTSKGDSIITTKEGRLNVTLRADLRAGLNKLFDWFAEASAEVGASVSTSIAGSISTASFWNTTSIFAEKEIIEERFEFDVPPRTSKTAYQLIGICGPYVVKTNRIVIRDVKMTVTGNSSTLNLQAIFTLMISLLVLLYSSPVC